MDRITAVTTEKVTRSSEQITKAEEGMETEFSYPPPAPSPKAEDDLFEVLWTSFTRLASRTSPSFGNEIFENDKERSKTIVAFLVAFDNYERISSIYSNNRKDWCLTKCLEFNTSFPSVISATSCITKLIVQFCKLRWRTHRHRNQISVPCQAAYIAIQWSSRLVKKRFQQCEE